MMNGKERRKNYKYSKVEFSMYNKKGQIAIFIIIALVIVAIILVVFLYPKIQIAISGELSPSAYLKSCMEGDVKKNIEVLAKQGGYAKPEGFILYQGEKIKYLCYTSEYYKTCVVQQPMIKEHFEQELSSLLAGRAEQCMQNLKKEYEKRGYDVSVGKVDSTASLEPRKIKIKFLSPMTITKESSQNFKEFDVEINSGMYDLLLTTVSIIDYESSLGDSETTLYIQYYPDLKIEKTKLSDGSKVYKLTNVITNESFTFASRSLAWPPGYGLE